MGVLVEEAKVSSLKNVDIVKWRSFLTLNEWAILFQFMK